MTSSQQLLVFIADFVFPSRRFSSDYHQSEFGTRRSGGSGTPTHVRVSGSAEFRSIPTIPLQDEGQEADGEEDDEDDEDDEAWRRGRGSSEVRMKQIFPEEPVRKRVVGNRQEEVEDT